MAMAEGGYDANFVEEVLTDLKCVVCHYPFKKPVQIIQCGHRFCKECFKQMKDYSSTQLVCYFLVIFYFIFLSVTSQNF